MILSARTGQGAASGCGAPLDPASCRRLLQGVSRSFALSIPLLRRDLAASLALAYLHLRFIDTIEDELNLPPAARMDLLAEAAQLYTGGLQDLQAAAALQAAVLRCLPEGGQAALRELAGSYLPLIAATRARGEPLTAPLCRCASLMACGMAGMLAAGPVRDYPALERYCYCSAGVVGELLVRLFAPARAVPADADPLAVSFAQGLQMINMLRDAAHDRSQGRTFLTPCQLRSAHFAGLCRAHLDHGLDFVRLCDARRQSDIRHFCLFNAALAYAALRLSLGGCGTRHGRARVRRLWLATALAARSERLLSWLIPHLCRGLPGGRCDAAALRARVSRWSDRELPPRMRGQSMISYVPGAAAAPVRDISAPAPVREQTANAIPDIHV